METITSEVIFSKIKYYLMGKVYTHIQGENNIFTLFNMPCISYYDEKEEEEISYVEIYHLYKNGQFEKSFALHKCLIKLNQFEKELIIGENIIRNSLCKSTKPDSFEELNYLSNFNSIFPNSHLFDLRVVSPERFYLEAKSIF